MMRKLAASSLAALAVVGGVSVVHAPAAEAAGCATKREFRKVHRGMTQMRVTRIFGIRGRFGDGGAGGFSRVYNQCNSRRQAAVEFRTLIESPPRTTGWKRWGIR
jgi:hypothetical protein